LEIFVRKIIIIMIYSLGQRVLSACWRNSNRFFVQLIIAPVVLGEELVESAFALGWKHVRGDTVHGLVAGRKKTGGVDLGVVVLSVRKAL